MQVKLRTVFFAFVATTLFGGCNVGTTLAAGKDETAKEKVQEAANDTSRATKKAVRKVKDETCEMINGKMKCVGKKIKHAAQNAGDKVEDAVD